MVYNNVIQAVVMRYQRISYMDEDHPALQEPPRHALHRKKEKRQTEGEEEDNIQEWGGSSLGISQRPAANRQRLQQLSGRHQRYLYDHGRRSVGDGGGTRPPLVSVGGSIGIVPPPLFSSEKLPLHRTS